MLMSSNRLMSVRQVSSKEYSFGLPALNETSRDMVSRGNSVPNPSLGWTSTHYRRVETLHHDISTYIYIYIYIYIYQENHTPLKPLQSIYIYLYTRWCVCVWLTSGRWTNPNSCESIDVFVISRRVTTDSWIVQFPKSMSVQLK